MISSKSHTERYFSCFAIYFCSCGLVSSKLGLWRSSFLKFQSPGKKSHFLCQFIYLFKNEITKVSNVVLQSEKKTRKTRKNERKKKGFQTFSPMTTSVGTKKLQTTSSTHTFHPYICGPSTRVKSSVVDSGRNQSWGSPDTSCIKVTTQIRVRIQ